MIIKSAKFIASFPNVSSCPDDTKPEFAFIGRSNVGKSSLINYLVNHQKLAKTSSTPGKTQLINYFLINDAWYLVDLPGYGYAKVSKTERKKFASMIKHYLSKRAQLSCVFQLIDSRIPPQDSDIEHINWLGQHQIPFVIVFTKADKPRKVKENIQAFENRMGQEWDALPELFASSSAKKVGDQRLLQFIENIVEQWGEHE